MDTQLEAATILVVDDDHDTVDTTALILEHTGFRTLSAYDAETAVKLASVFYPQVALLDLAMPGCDGFRLAGRLRQLPGMDNAVFICISGYGTAKDRLRSAEAGFNHHLVKPVHWNELLGLLARTNGAWMVCGP